MAKLKYKFTKRTVHIPDNDTDIALTLPSGERVTLQYRIENQSLDILFDQPRAVYVEDGDMQRVKADRQGRQVARQIVILP